MIPPNKKEAVKNALQIAFGVTGFESIAPITIGLSTALTFKITVQGKPYLLRVATSTDAINDPTHYYACMQPAAEAAIAPRVLYASIPDRISITDFIDAKPFSKNQGRAMLPRVLKRLHALPPFPYRINFMDVCNGFIQKFKSSNPLPETIAELFSQYERIRNVYPRNTSDWVSCHTDLKKDNILFDGKQVWLVDWEAAFLNDRYVDLAAIANFIITNEAEETAFLTSYFGTHPTDYQRARFFLVQQIVHLFCFVLCAQPAGAGKPVDVDMKTPTFREFHNSLWAGTINLGDSNLKHQYALVHLQQLQYNLLLPRFEESLAVVKEN
jgi:thiamine kinase-like enzyme